MMSEKKHGRVTAEMLEKSKEKHDQILKAILKKEIIYKKLRDKLLSKHIYYSFDIFKADEEMKRQEKIKAIKFSNKMAALNLPFNFEYELTAARRLLMFIGSLFKEKILVFHLKENCPYLELTKGLEKFLMFFNYMDNRFLIVKDRPLVTGFSYEEFKKTHETVTRNSDYAATSTNDLIEDFFNPLRCIDLMKKGQRRKRV